MKRYFLLLLLAGLPTLAADVSEPSPVVRVRSGLCDGNRSKLLGSGLTLAHGGALYVLTAAHATFNGRKPFCHEIEHPAFGKLDAEFVVAEAGYDLALLRVVSNRAIPSIAFNDLKHNSEVKRNDPVTVTGFPDESDSGEGILDINGYVLQPKSGALVLPLRNQVLELSGAYGSPGMSGGPVLSATGKVIGVLSHQRPRGRHFSLLAVPVSDVVKFLSHYFTDPETFRPVLRIDPEYQFRGKHRWYGADLIFDFLPPSNIAIASTTIGKGDGVGGGKEGPGWKVKVSYAESSGTAENTLARPEWAKRLRQRLSLSDSTAEVPFFIRRKADETRFPIREEIGSIAEFFHLLGDLDRTPVTHLSSRILRTDEAVTKLTSLTHRLDAGVSQLRGSTEDSKAIALLDRIGLLVLLARDDWRVVAVSDIDLCLGDRAGWRELLSIDLEAAQRAFSLLREMQFLIEKIGVRP